MFMHQRTERITAHAEVSVFIETLIAKTIGVEPVLQIEIRTAGLVHLAHISRNDTVQDLVHKLIVAGHQSKIIIQFIVHGSTVLENPAVLGVLLLDKLLFLHDDRKLVAGGRINVVTFRIAENGKPVNGLPHLLHIHLQFIESDATVLEIIQIAVQGISAVAEIDHRAELPFRHGTRIHGIQYPSIVPVLLLLDGQDMEFPVFILPSPALILITFTQENLHSKEPRFHHLSTISYQKTGKRFPAKRHTSLVYYTTKTAFGQNKKAAEKTAFRHGHRSHSSIAILYLLPASCISKYSS